MEDQGGLGLAAQEGRVNCIIELDGSVWNMDRGPFLASREQG